MKTSKIKAKFQSKSWIFHWRKYFDRGIERHVLYWVDYLTSFSISCSNIYYDFDFILSSLTTNNSLYSLSVVHCCCVCVFWCSVLFSLCLMMSSSHCLPHRLSHAIIRRTRITTTLFTRRNFSSLFDSKLFLKSLPTSYFEYPQCLDQFIEDCRPKYSPQFTELFNLYKNADIKELKEINNGNDHDNEQERFVRFIDIGRHPLSLSIDPPLPGIIVERSFYPDLFKLVRNEQNAY